MSSSSSSDHSLMTHRLVTHDSIKLNINQSLRQQFGDVSVQQIDKLLPLHSPEGLHQSLMQVLLPEAVVFFLGALVQHAGLQASKPNLTVHRNACSLIKALLEPGHAWTKASSAAFGKRLLEFPEASRPDLKFLEAPGSSDSVAVRFLAKIVMDSNMSAAAAVAAAVEEEEDGRRCLEAFRTSDTLAAVVMCATWRSWWDDSWNWTQGAGQWVKEAVSQFGEEAAMLARAVVDAVFSQFSKAAIKAWENEIPGLGLVFAGIYAAAAGDADREMGALAVNVNAAVSLIGGAIVAGVGGAAAGISLQQALSRCTEEPSINADAADISAAGWIIEMTLGGGAAGGSGPVVEALGSAAGLNVVEALCVSETFAGFLSQIPLYNN